MSDLLIVLFAIAMIVGLAAIKSADEQRSLRNDAERRLEDLQSTADAMAAKEVELQRVRGELGDWQLVAREVAGKFRQSVADPAVAGESPAELRRILDRIDVELESGKEGLQSIERRAEELRKELNKAASQLAKAEDRARQAEAELEGRIRETQQKLRNAEGEIQELRAQGLSSSGDVEQARARVRELEKDLAEMAQTAQALQARADEASDRANSANERVATATEEAKAAIERIRDDQRGINQQLLGITGDLHDVIFVVDRSDSMRKDGRWEDAKRTIRAWLEHLPVRRSALVVFGSKVTAFPDTTELVSLDAERRREFVGELDTLEPRGNTMTLRALQRAMRYEAPDAIILFTDGKPENGSGDRGGGDPREAVLKLVREYHTNHPETRLHAVGIGDYFDEDMRDFLLKLAKSTGGTFIGR
jgi:uncharacterized coiled-coil DUF342 family protein